MPFRRAKKPWIIALLAYALFFQAMVGSMAHARMVVRAFDPAAAFAPMASLCLTGTSMPDAPHNQRPDDQNHAPCCVLAGRVDIAPPVGGAVIFVLPRDPKRVVFHAKRNVLAVALAPPHRVQPRGPPVSA